MGNPLASLYQTHLPPIFKDRILKGDNFRHQWGCYLRLSKGLKVVSPVPFGHDGEAFIEDVRKCLVLQAAEVTVCFFGELHLYSE